MHYRFVILLLLLPVAASAQPHFAFKGIRLGMTYSQMRTLLARTSWDYRYDFEREDNIGSIDAIPYDASNPDMDTLAILSCVDGDSGEVCPKLLHLKAAFIKGRIYSILIRSPEYEARDWQQLQFYVQALQRRITSTLGPGTEGEIALDSLDMERLSAIKDGEYPDLMIWEWKRQKTRNGSPMIQDARIYIEPQGLGEYSIVFTITDYRLLRSL
jgi:hypothetical protein